MKLSAQCFGLLAFQVLGISVLLGFLALDLAVNDSQAYAEESGQHGAAVCRYWLCCTGLKRLG